MNQSAVGGASAAAQNTVADRVKRDQHARFRSRRVWFYGLAVFIALSIIAFNIIRPITVLPRIAPSPGFAFVGTDGQPVTSEDQRGFLTLYSFSYLDCDEACPQSFDAVAALRDSVAESLPPGTPLRLSLIHI